MGKRFLLFFLFLGIYTLLSDIKHINLERRPEHKTILTESHLVWQVPEPFHFLSSQSLSTTELLQSYRYES